MALNVSYKNRIGYYTLTQGENKFKIYFCHANALCAEMYFYTDKESGKKRVQLYSFYVDLQHLKNCAKDGLLDHYGNGITLFAKEMDKDLWEMVKIFAKNGISVKIK